MNSPEKRVSEVLNGGNSLDQVVLQLQKLTLDIDHILDTNPKLQKDLSQRFQDTAVAALKQGITKAKLDVQRTLREAFAPRSVNVRGLNKFSYHLNALNSKLAKTWLEHEIRQINLEGIPRSPISFRQWFLETIANHPSSDHVLYSYLEKQGNRDEFKYFVAQERPVDLEFANHIALSQFGAEGGLKQEMAKNYWDEMGAGNPNKNHAYMYRRVMSLLDVPNTHETEDLTWTALAVNNLFSSLSHYHEFHQMSIGCLAATEMAVPKRFERLVQAGQRLSFPQEVIDYYYFHVIADSDHMSGWLDEVVLPSIARCPEIIADEIALGIMLRLNVSKANCDMILNNFQSRKTQVFSPGS
jgi:Iron-containing redox enzyme